MSELSTPACSVCGGTDLVRDIDMSQSVETGHVGLRYKSAKVFISVEPLRADLCRQCGSIVRLHVKQTDRNWLTA